MKSYYTGRIGKIFIFIMIFLGIFCNSFANQEINGLGKYNIDHKFENISRMKVNDDNSVSLVGDDNYIYYINRSNSRTFIELIKVILQMLNF